MPNPDQLRQAMENVLARTEKPEPLTIGQLVTRSHEIAVSKGWHEPPTIREPDYFSKLVIALLLIHSEVSEATEEARKGCFSALYYVNGKPEGVLSELADVVIRVADLCGSHGWNLEEAIVQKMAYNAGRPHRHGNELF